MEREVGGGIRMGNTCKPMAVSFQCMTKSTTKKKKKKTKASLIPLFQLRTWRLRDVNEYPKLTQVSGYETCVYLMSLT